MADSTAAIQAALIARYRADASLQGLMTGASAPNWNIFDQGGSGNIVSVFPCIEVHPIAAQTGTAQAFGMDAMDVFVQVSVFTKSLGFAQARAIASRVYALTHGPVAGNIPLQGFTNVLTVFDNRQELEQTTDALEQHIADRYKVWTQG